jgi:hypothetical protein
MINGHTLKNLLKNIDSIHTLVTNRGFKNIRLFEPLDRAEENELNFIVAFANETLSIYDKARLKLELCKFLQILDNELLLVVEDNLNPQAAELVVGEQVSISENNTLAILEFFNHHFNMQLSQENKDESFKFDISEVIELMRGTMLPTSQEIAEQDIKISPRKGYVA